MKSPLLRFSVFYVFGGLALIGLSGFLEGMAIARPLFVVWALVGVPLFLIVLGRMNRESSVVAELIYLLGLATLGLLLVVGIYRIWPLVGQLKEVILGIF